MNELIRAIAHPINSLTEAFKEKAWLSFALLCVFYLALLSLAILMAFLLLAFLMGAISSVYQSHKAAIDGGIFLILCLFAFAFYLREHTAPQKQVSAPQPDASLEKESAERTYRNIASVILPVFQKSASIYPLVSPITVSDIFSPARARKEGEIWLYHYAAVKRGAVDVDAVKRFLGDELTRILFNHESHGLARPTVFVEGVEYPALVVTAAKDTGFYLEFSIAVMSLSVKRLLDFRHAAVLSQRGNAANADDEQFI